MAFIDCHFHSDVLGMASSMHIILPQAARTQIGMVSSSGGPKRRTLFLLHGLSDDHTIWLRRTSIERYVAGLGLAVVMPNIHRSFYTDMIRGGRYWTFLSDEMPVIARSFFPLSDAREDNFVAGNSMGGYGAFKLALRCPDRFAAAASLSGVLDLASRVKRAEGKWKEELANTFGDPDTIAGSENDPLHLAARVAESKGPKPKLYQCCGTEDELYRDNLTFRDYAKNLGLDLTYEEEKEGHNWDYWDAVIPKVLDWLPLT